ncbi:hypothetical protein LT493_13585 [Streptomyces tricolor]|nr:hypothetical protein [Streptomyces tricolor]
MLVQTERPPLLRARMLSVGWDGTGRSPAPDGRLLRARGRLTASRGAFRRPPENTRRAT